MDRLSRAGIREGALKNHPLRAVQEVGDPMMPAALGLMRGLGCSRVVLSGGTQMAAVLALAKALEIQGDISIATTKYIIEDRSAGFKEIVEAAGRPYFFADPGLERSKIPPVHIYAQGGSQHGSGKVFSKIPCLFLCQAETVMFTDIAVSFFVLGLCQPDRSRKQAVRLIAAFAGHHNKGNLPRL